MANPPIDLTIRTREDVLFQGEVSAVSSINEKGRFDVLPFHASFISLIQQKIVIHERNYIQREILIGVGIMHVADNHVKVYLETLGSDRNQATVV